MKSAVDLLKDEFGCDFVEVENPLIAAIGAVAAPFLAPSGNRLAFLFVNLSVNVIYIRPHQAPTAAIGIVTEPNGGWRSFYFKEDFTATMWDWWCVAPAGASNLYVAEIRSK